MTFELDAPMLALQRFVSELAADRLAEGALARAHDPSFPRSVSRDLAGHGLLGLTLPGVQPLRHPGGVLAAVVAIEALARLCPRSADVLHHGNFGAAALVGRYGSADQHHRFLVPLLAGEAVMGLAISEAEAGAAATQLETSVTRAADGYRLTGAKTFAAQSNDADHMVIVARFGATVADVGAVIVARDQRGVLLGEPVAFMSDEVWRPLAFEDVRVPDSDVLSASGVFTTHGAFFDIEKIGNAARALGVGWCAFDAARAYAAERRQFGRPLCEFQGLQWMQADVRAALEAAQLVLYRAAARADAEALAREDASLAKLLCNRAAMAACNEAVQILGARGYGRGSLAEYCFRKARGFLINGGTAELMKTRIAETIFDRSFPQQAA